MSWWRGKHYFILGKMISAILVVRVSIDSVKKGSEDSGKRERLMANLTPKAIALETLENYVQAKRQSAKAASARWTAVATYRILEKNGMYYSVAW